MLEKMKGFASANKKWLLIGGAVLLVAVAAVILLLTIGGGKDPSDDSSATVPGKITYTVTVTDDAGTPLSEIGVYVYADATVQEFVWFARTDPQGKISFNADQSSTYHAVLTDVPGIYMMDESYPMTQADTVITLKRGTMEDYISSGYKLAVGDVMPEFTITDVDGNVLTLTELLGTYKAVVLNFWFEGCDPCKSEFPYLQDGYSAYSDHVAVIAISVTDSESTIRSFRDANGYTFAMASCEQGWADVFGVSFYPTTVVIDRERLISLSHSSAITEDYVFENMFAYYADDVYVSGVVSDLEPFKPAENGTGTKDDPFEFGGTNQIEVTVAPGSSVYCQLFRMSGMQITAEYSQIWLKYNDVTYYPENGVLSLMTEETDTFTPMDLEIGNSGTEQMTFILNFEVPKGNSDNPYDFALGEFTVDIEAGNDQGVYYKYVAQRDETITLECLGCTDGVYYGMSMYNLNTYVYLTMSSVDGENTLSMDVSAGDMIQIAFNSVPDEEYNYPAVQLSIKATSSAGAGGGETPDDTPKTQKYTVTVVNSEGKGVANVVIRFTGLTGITNYTTDATGTVSVELNIGTYKAKVIAVPDGYAVDTTEYSLNDSVTTAKITLKNAEPPKPDTLDFTVTVKDDAGRAVSGVQIFFKDSLGGGTTVTTDGSGKATAALPAGNYTATVLSVPEGYVMPTVTTATLTEKATAATMTVPKYKEPEPVYATYTVNVKDASGKAVSGVKIKITGDNYSKEFTSNASGTVSTQLLVGTYTVSVVSVPDGYEMNDSKYTLTDVSHGVSIIVSKKAAAEPQTGTYTITVKDSNGKAVAGALLKFSGSGYSENMSTDSNGKVSVTLVLGTYEVSLVSVPDSYVLSDTRVTLTKTSTSKTMTVALKTADYKVTVKDTNGKAVSGVKLTIGSTTVTTNASGVATANLVVGNYTVKVTSVPSAYNLPDATFNLTATTTSTPITLTLKTATYSVFVKDPDGNAVPGAVVKITTSAGNRELKTDASGKVSADLVLGTYTVKLVSVPEGYELNDDSFQITQSNPSVTITVEIPAPQTGIYSFTVTDSNGKAVSGAVLKFEGSVGSVNLTTDASGKISRELLLDDYTVTMVSAPSDYKVYDGSVKLSETSLSGTMTLQFVTKNYKVTVEDEEGNGISGVSVKISGNGLNKTFTTDSKGVVAQELPVGNYTVKITAVPEGYQEYTDSESLTKSKNSITITLAEIVLPYTDPFGERYVVEAGSTKTLTLVTGKAVYFEFTPTRSGLYRITVTGGKITEAGGSFFVNAITPATSVDENVKEGHLGQTYVFGITATGSNTSGTVKITRVGNAKTDYMDEPWTVYDATISHSNKHAFTGDKSNLTFVDVTKATSAYKLTKEGDTYYINGKKAYVDLSTAPYVSFNTILQTSAIRAYFFDEKGEFVKKEEYSDCIMEYITCAGNSGIHVLTDDLIYILKTYGEAAGWWDPSGAYLFGEVSGLNTEIAWMFSICY